MEKELYFGVGSERILESYEHCKKCIPKLRDIPLVHKGDGVYCVYNWKEYTNLLDSLVSDIVGLICEISDLYDLMPDSDFEKDSFLVDEETAAGIKKCINASVEVAQRYVDICDSVIAGKYTLTAEFIGDVAPELYAGYRDKLKIALVDNPFMQGAGITINPYPIEASDIRLRFLIQLGVTGEEAFTVVKRMVKLYAKAISFYPRVMYARGEKELLVEYSKSHSEFEWDFRVLDIVETALQDKAVTELESDLGKLETEEQKAMVRKSTEALIDMIADYDMEICLAAN